MGGVLRKLLLIILILPTGIILLKAVIKFLELKRDCPSLTSVNSLIDVLLSTTVLLLSFLLMIIDKIVSEHKDHPKMKETYITFDAPLFICISLTTSFVLIIKNLNPSVTNDLLMFGAGANAFQAILATLMFDEKDLAKSTLCTTCNSVIIEKK